MEKQSPILSTPQYIPSHFYPHSKPTTLGENTFHKSLVTHLKSTGSVNYDPGSSETTHKRLKECQKVFKTQDKLSNLHVSLDISKHLENKLLFPTIQHFSSLSSLSLEFHGNRQTNLIPQEVPFKILTSLKQLNHLDISFHSARIRDAKNLKKLMKTIQKLKRLSSFSLTYFNCYGLGPSHYGVLLLGLAKMSQLRTLKLGFDNSRDLFNSDIELFADFLPKLSLLTKIDLIFKGWRDIRQQTLLRLFKAFQSLKNLSGLGLNLQDCSLNYCAAGGIGSLEESLKCLVGTSIERLSLDLFRNLDNQNLQELSETLKQLTLLKSLSLNLHGLSKMKSQSIVSFGSALACLTSLASLSLHFPSGGLHKDLVQSIASALMALQQNLISLKLEFRMDSETEDQHFQALFASLKNFKSLKYLDIQIVDQETMTDASLEIFGKSLKELNLLRSLSLDFTSVLFITEKSIEAIFSAIQEGLSNLFSLRLKFKNYEKLNEITMSKLAEALQILTELYSVDLYLYACGFKDVFTALGSIRNLGEIKLSLPDSKRNHQEVDCLEKRKDILRVEFFKRLG